MSSDTSRTAIVQPVLRRSSPRGRCASSLSMIRSACAPKIFHTPWAASSGSPLRSISCGATAGAAAAVPVASVIRLDPRWSRDCLQPRSG
jgi:hypothetical protein